MSSNMVNQTDNKCRITLNRDIYALPAIMKTAYLFTEQFYIYMDIEDEQYLRVDFKAKPILSKEEAEQRLGEFHNELLHQCIRLEVAKQTKEIRELVMGRALYSTVIETNKNIEQSDPASYKKPAAIGSDWDNQGIGLNFFDLERKEGI